MEVVIPSLKVDRFKKIIAIVNSNKSISLSDLEKMLNVSRITVQRDLVELENRKLLRRFHGGAMSLEYSEKLYNHEMKKGVNVVGKKDIAVKAVTLIKDGSFIGLDSSSTVYYLSETVFAGNVLVLSCGMEAFKNLASREDIRVILAGGRLNKMTNTLCGPETVAMIRKFHFDIVFISAESCMPDQGFFDPHEEEVLVKRALIESANTIVMLLDSTKMVPISGIKFCDMDEVDYVVTDKPEMPGLKKIFKDRLL
jgi:DeoR family fructose operon transcriptional repressor